ncbi:Repeat domain-containing protein [Micromonospora viridifaciens]|uniref:Repeat domain-containing protein n=1 Tax=Micromonospora viridifaciens TaxID=1881 RepID=A0A1C4VRH5_MICVI|nr:VCBS repeat-containing protein [Micromonospora viridifaciens]SCE86602.1 Repeat domain-containing protein [Micromonospora viridifaciens]
MQQNLSTAFARRAAAMAGALAMAAGGLVGLSPAPAQASSIDGPISRSEILSRAQNWVDRGITYTQTGTWASDIDGSHTYRRDCSGLVSMAWHLNTSYVTGDFQKSNSRWTTLASIHDFQAGDAMVRTGHMELFSHWKDKNDHSKGAYVYSFNSSGETVQNPYAPNNAGKLGFNSASDLATYKPIRRTGLINGPAARKGPALAHDDGDGTMTIHRWNSTGSAFDHTTDYKGDGAFHLSNVGDRVAAGDVDGDGSDDVVMAYQLSDGTFGFYVFDAGLTSRGRWYTSGPYNLGPVAGRLVVADFNGDGKAEPALVHDDGDGTMTIHRWLSTGSSFSRTTDYTGDGTFRLSNVGDRVAAGDVTGDGKADIVMAYQLADGTFGYYVWSTGLTSLGRWYTSGTYNLGPVANRLVVDDFNGDGKAEPALVHDDGDGTMTIHRWLSTGSSFSRTTDYTGDGTFRLSNVGDRVAAGDVTGDGKADIVMTYQLADGTFGYYVWSTGLTSLGRWYTSGAYNLGPVDGRMVLGNW